MCRFTISGILDGILVYNEKPNEKPLRMILLADSMIVSLPSRFRTV